MTKRAAEITPAGKNRAGSMFGIVEKRQFLETFYKHRAFSFRGFFISISRKTVLVKREKTNVPTALSGDGDMVIYAIIL